MGIGERERRGGRGGGKGLKGETGKGGGREVAGRRRRKR